MPSHASIHRHRHHRELLLLFFILLLKYCHAVKNDATEMLHGHIIPLVQEETPTNTNTSLNMNRARNGGRTGFESAAKLDQSQVGCRELRSTKYISDGQCTSLSPVKELVCAGECLPAHLLPNWIGTGGAGAGYSGRYWTRRDAQEWRCVTDRTRTQRIRLQCLDGSTRTYKIQAVTACKCKRYSRQHNDSVQKSDGTGTGTGTGTSAADRTFGFASTQPQPQGPNQSPSQNQNQPGQHKKRRSKNGRNKPPRSDHAPRNKP
ncbi:sclerostin domain-containing protein 1b [Engraulis encrasicolus]|uniref:sclerostin domain-containing protein 1b n=1 Tax=Engraulis encrasicolus TaxID=184585 RepID=UPI002FD423BE